MMNFTRMIWLIMVSSAMFVFLPVERALAENNGNTKAETEAADTTRAHQREAIATLGNLLKTRKEQIAVVKNLKKMLRAAKEDATRAELQANITDAQNKLSQFDAQLTAISTGVADDAFANRQGKTV